MLPLGLALISSCLALAYGPAVHVRGTTGVTTPSFRTLGRPLAVQMSERWDDAILNSELPDPIFDSESPYKGRVPYGFSENAEKLNGRVAMMGFTIVFLQEGITGRGVLQQYGLPYDAGAIVPPMDGFVLPPPVALLIATVVSFGMIYVGEFIDDKLRKEPVTGITKLPFGAARKE